jgi:hypothetical protein
VPLFRNKVKRMGSSKTQFRPALIALEFSLDQVHHMDMLILKAVKFRIKTNKTIEPSFCQRAGSRRWFWNRAQAILEERIEAEKNLELCFSL